jgi:hypothetical protein
LDDQGFQKRSPTDRFVDFGSRFCQNQLARIASFDEMALFVGSDENGEVT